MPVVIGGRREPNWSTIESDWSKVTETIRLGELEERDINLLIDGVGIMIQRSETRCISIPEVIR
jgi:hypothetical protein